MFDLGIQELVVIFVVALMVFGPKRLPELARTMGKAMGQLKKAMHDIKTEVDKEMEEINPLPKLDELSAFKNLPEDMKERVFNPDSKKETDESQTLNPHETSVTTESEPIAEQESPAISKDGEPVMYSDDDMEDVPDPEKGDEA
ncbi:Sec-independent protein translocase protein TatB [Nitrospirota bacterium]